MIEMIIQYRQGELLNSSLKKPISLYTKQIQLYIYFRLKAQMWKMYF